MNLMVEQARAYVYAGQWVADCPRACGNVEPLFESSYPNGPRNLRKSMFRCTYCKMITTNIEWPSGMDEIMGVLELRPIPHTRNWYPPGHVTALKFGLPDGQSIADLKTENEEHGIHS